MADQLHPFEGVPVVKARIALKTPGGALDNTMDVDPREWSTGDIVHIVLRTRVGTVSFPEHSKGNADELDRLHELKADLVTVVDASVVEAVLEAQERKIEEAQGIQRLDLVPDEGEDDEFEPIVPVVN